MDKITVIDLDHVDVSGEIFIYGICMQNTKFLSLKQTRHVFVKHGCPPVATKSKYGKNL